MRLAQDATPKHGKAPESLGGAYWKKNHARDPATTGQCRSRFPKGERLRTFSCHSDGLTRILGDAITVAWETQIAPSGGLKLWQW